MSFELKGEKEKQKETTKFEREDLCYCMLKHKIMS